MKGASRFDTGGKHQYQPVTQRKIASGIKPTSAAAPHSKDRFCDRTRGRCR